MKNLMAIFLFLGHLSIVAQTSFPTFATCKNDTTTFLQFLPIKADYIFAYSAESYWWSDTENFRLLSRTGKIWTMWTYYKKWKNSENVNINKEKEHFKKVRTLDSATVTELFDSLELVNLWTLNMDSLNETRGISILDDVNYKFQIEDNTGRQILESYAPEYFIQNFPYMRQRVSFLRGKEIFLRWWKRLAANKVLPKAGLNDFD